MAFIAINVPVEDVFPGSGSDLTSLRDQLGRLSRTDTLFWCARFNLVVSNPCNANHRAKQEYVLRMCLGSEELRRVDDFVRQHGGIGQVAVFFRGQLLELLRWAATFCEEKPDDGETFESSERRRAFAQAAMIAGDLWLRRVYADRLSVEDGVDAARRRALGSFRQAIAETTSGMEPLLALGRGRALMRERMTKRYPPFEEEFRSRTGLSLDEYYLCVAAVMTHAIDKLARAEWRPVSQDVTQARRIFPVLAVYDPLLEAPGHARFLAEEFEAALRPDEGSQVGDMTKGRFRVAPLTVMTIDDIENLETSTQTFALRDLLTAYSAECPDRAESLRDFLARSAFGQQLVYSQSLAQRSLDALQAALESMRSGPDADCEAGSRGADT